MKIVDVLGEHAVAENISMSGSDTFAVFSLMRLSLITFDWRFILVSVFYSVFHVKCLKNFL